MTVKAVKKRAEGLELVREKLYNCNRIYKREREARKMANGKVWLFWLLLFSGIILGGLLGELATNVSFLSWLGYGQTFGLTQPLILDLGVINLTFAILFKLNVASILGIFLSIFAYRKL